MLLDDRELTAFLALTAALDELLPAPGGRLSYRDALRSGVIWDTVLAAARTLDELIEP